jgi:hypothetical protein
METVEDDSRRNTTSTSNITGTDDAATTKVVSKGWSSLLRRRIFRLRRKKNLSPTAAAYLSGEDVPAVPVTTMTTTSSFAVSDDDIHCECFKGTIFYIQYHAVFVVICIGFCVPKYRLLAIVDRADSHKILFFCDTTGLNEVPCKLFTHNTAGSSSQFETF